MANVGTAAAGKTLIGAGNTSSPTFADIGTNSGLTNNGVLVANGNSPFTATAAGVTGQVLMGNTGADPSFQTGGTTLTNTLTGNTGGALSPTAGNFNITGAGSITVAGAGSTLTPQLTGLTANTILLGAGTSTINPLANSTTGNILVANTGADPGWASTLAGSFTLSKSNSGGDVSFNVINTSNTASSTANITVQTAGGTASDPYQVFKIASGQEWSMGLDNSDSDAFVVSSSNALGTNNVMRVATTGEITYPLQSCFYGQLATAASNVTGDGTDCDMGGETPALTEIYDRNGDFSVGDGAGTSATYTAPVTGILNLVFQVLLQDVIATATCTMQIVTSNRTYTYGNTGTSFIGNMPLLTQALADMDAADTATFRVSVSNMTKIVDVYASNSTDARSYVQGWLLG